MRKLISSVALAAGALLFIGGNVAAATGAGALTIQPGGLVPNPTFCTTVTGDPTPCPRGPVRPDPVDPHCLRTDILPLDCAYLP